MADFRNRDWIILQLFGFQVHPRIDEGVPQHSTQRSHQIPL